MMALLSNALSAISASKGQPFDQRRDADRVEALSGQAARKRTRLPSASVSARILVVIPPFGAADGLVLRPPFAPCPWAVDLDDGGIDHDVFHVRLV